MKKTKFEMFFFFFREEGTTPISVPMIFEKVRVERKKRSVGSEKPR